MIVQIDPRMQVFTSYTDRDMLFQIKTSITKKGHSGEFTISVMLLRNGKPATYIIKVIISKFVGVNDNLFGPNSLIMELNNQLKIIITFSRIKVDKYGKLYLNISNSFLSIID